MCGSYGCFDPSRSHLSLRGCAVYQHMKCRVRLWLRLWLRSGCCCCCRCCSERYHTLAFDPTCFTTGSYLAGSGLALSSPARIQTRSDTLLVGILGSGTGFADYSRIPAQESRRIYLVSRLILNKHIPKMRCGDIRIKKAYEVEIIGEMQRRFTSFEPAAADLDDNVVKPDRYEYQGGRTMNKIASTSVHVKGRQCYGALPYFLRQLLADLECGSDHSSITAVTPPMVHDTVSTGLYSKYYPANSFVYSPRIEYHIIRVVKARACVCYVPPRHHHFLYRSSCTVRNLTAQKQSTQCRRRWPLGILFSRERRLISTL